MGQKRYGAIVGSVYGAFIYVIGVFTAVLGISSVILTSYFPTEVVIASSAAIAVIGAGVDRFVRHKLSQAEKVHVDASFAETLGHTSYEIAIPAAIPVIAGASRLAAEVFDDVIDAEHDMQMSMINPYDNVIITTTTGEVVGYIDVFGLQQSPFDDYVSGKISAADFTPDMMLKWPEVARTDRLWIGGMVVREPSTYEGKIRASLLVWGMLKLLEVVYLHNKNEIDLYSAGYSPEGQRLLRNMRFTKISSGEKSIDKYPLYYRRVTLAEVRDWNNSSRRLGMFCDLRIADPFSKAESVSLPTH